MNPDPGGKIFKVLTGLYLVAAFAYIILVIRPDLYFHHVQPPFLLTPGFLAGYLKDPGGLSQWLSLLFMQGFYNRILGPILFYGMVLVQWGLSLFLMNRIHRATFNVLLSMLPFSLSIVLVNNYNFPYAVTVSQVLMLLLIWILSIRSRGRAGSFLIYTAGALVIWYASGSGFLVIYALSSLFFTLKKGSWNSFLMLPLVLGSVCLLPLLAGQNQLWFYTEKVYFMTYESSPLFYIYLFSLPLILLPAFLLPFFQRRLKLPGRKLNPAITVTLAAIFLIGLALTGHLLAFRPDAKKIVESDYYCYQQEAKKVAKAAMSLESYSFAANVNYNLAISRRGTLTLDFFDFFQISGSEALQPDVDFSAEMLFIAADFYYDLAYISEARHNAYEALVYYPQSPRALQLLTKVHLVCGEYKAAERCLRILDKGLVSRRFVKEFWPCIEDTSQLASNEEIMDKRAFMPAEKELSPNIDQRLRDLLEANPENSLAYEYLMLYHLLEGELQAFLDLYLMAGDRIDKSLEVYEEAVLMHGMMTLTKDVAAEYQVSEATLERFEDFGRMVNQYKDDPGMARNVLYHEMGQSYFYYLGYLYPRIVKPVRAKEEFDEAPI